MGARYLDDAATSKGPMAGLKVAVVGHVVPEPRVMALPTNRTAARNLLRLRNFTRIATDDGRLVEHLAFLREQSGAPGDKPLSVWEMYLCSGLLLASWVARNGFDVQLVNYIDS